MKVYIAVDETGSVTGLATFPSGEAAWEIEYDAVDIDGFFVEAGMLKYSGELAERKKTEKAEEQAVKQAEEQLESLRRLEILASLDDDHALAVKVLFPKWKAGRHYKTGERILYQDRLYKVLQEHDSQETWTPADAHSLFKEIE